MLTTYLRASTITTYKDCEWKYYLQYIIGFQDHGSKKTVLGTICHHVLEILAKAKKVNHKGKKIYDTDYLLKICWKRYSEQHKQFIFLPEDYKFCTKIIKTVLDGVYNPANLNILDIEKQFEITLKRVGCEFEQYDPIKDVTVNDFLKLRGTIDLIAESDPDTIELIDWKTGDRKDWITGEPKGLDGFQKDTQLRLYDLVLKHLYPEYKYRLITIVYIRDGGAFTVTFSNKERTDTFNGLRTDFHSIKSNNNPKRLKDDKSRSKFHWKCKYVCGFGDKSKDEKGQCDCDKYFEIFKESSYSDATRQLYNISLNGASIASRRNDYNRESIQKLTINQNDTL